MLFDHITKFNKENTMKITKLQPKQWSDVKEIYLEAFPKCERKPFLSLKRSVKKGKAIIYTATEDSQLLGFVAVMPYKNMVMVDYLAISGKIRSKGTGSLIMKEICEIYSDKKIVLLIEKIDDSAENSEQRVARRRFYIKNGFTSSDIFIEGVSGNMEILNYGEKVTEQEYLSLHEHALGKLFFRLSKISIVK